MRRVAVDGAELGVEVEGSGEPVLLIQTGLVADEFLPLASEPALRDHDRVIRYHRRGYRHSSPGPGRRLHPARRRRRPSAAGCTQSRAGLCRRGVLQRRGCSTDRGRLAELGAQPDRARAAAGARPERRPVLRGQPQLVEDYHAYGPVAGLDRFLTRVSGPDWRAMIRRALPGAAAQMEQDTDTFFDTDIPALLTWTFGAEDARRTPKRCCISGAAKAASGSPRSANSCSPGCHRPRTWCWPEPTTPWLSPTRPRSRQPRLPSCGATRSQARPAQPTRPSASHEPTRGCLETPDAQPSRKDRFYAAAAPRPPGAVAVSRTVSEINVAPPSSSKTNATTWAQDRQSGCSVPPTCHCIVAARRCAVMVPSVGTRR
jgi:hypothetical protein